MKIIHIVNNLDCGGMEKMVISLAVALKGRGYASRIICIADKGVLSSQAENCGVKVDAVGQRTGIGPMGLWKLFRLLQSERPDIIHLHNARALVYGSLVARFLGMPCVFTGHGSWISVSYRWVWARVKKNVVISNQARIDLLKNNPWLKSTGIAVILNAVNIKDYGAAGRATKIDPGVFVIGHVARLSSEKDQVTLIKSFSKVANVLGRQNARLVIVGDGLERAMLGKLALDLGLSSYVEFLGFRDDVPKVIDTFDVFVLSSITEGVSLTILEAMAASKPVVATRVGGNPEVVINGETGFLVPPQDPGAMADSILAFAHDPGLAKKMGMAGRKRAEQVFSLERMVDEYEKVYREATAS